ncbi:MAG: putative NOP5 family protein [Methanoregula sp. PtaU1.Bin051]|nr:MAG: putative NOP5 family protein [Methanoregula sp. PtaU1.Bin051]
MMQSYWFGDVGDDGCRPFKGDTAAIAERVRSLRIEMDSFIPLKWQSAADCGTCRDREDYIGKLRGVCMLLAERRIAEEYRKKDVALHQMVGTLDEMDNVINLLTGRAVDWYQVSHPSFSRKYRRKPPRTLMKTISRRGGGAISRMAADIERLSATRTALAREVSDLAGDVMPNCSALLGGLVAARLMFHAGGLTPLARLPASAIQVLGARTSLFSHLRSGTPPPKHGIIFQHRRVHNAPAEVRGKVARTLAAKLAIAARLDLYRGVAVPEFLENAQTKIDAAGNVL